MSPHQRLFSMYTVNLNSAEFRFLILVCAGVDHFFQVDHFKYSPGLTANKDASLNNLINYSIHKSTSGMAILMC